MKKIIWFLILSSFSFCAVAQKSERVTGVFQTGKDFMEDKLSFKVDCNSGNDKIRLNSFFNRNYITVKLNDSSINVQKTKLWGYQTCGKSIYRFPGKKKLLLLNRSESILIYKHILARRSVVGRTNVTPFYFSIGAEGELQKLTIKNLKQAFDGNERFNAAIDKDFKYNTDLAAVDECAKMYKINRLLQETQ